MIFSKDINPKVRFLVLLQDADMKLSRISKILGKSTSTLYDWKSKLEDGINFLEHQSKNFSPKIDSKKREAIVRQAQRSAKPSEAPSQSAHARLVLSLMCLIQVYVAF